jgi:hypothetical protein
MEAIRSVWKITFNPGGSAVVLVDYDDLIDQELGISLAAACEVIEPVDSANAYFRDGQTRTFTTSIKVYKTETLDVDARVAAMNSLLAAASYTKAPLRIQINGFSGHYWQFSSAFIKGHAPLREILSGRARWSKVWDIVATGMSYT